jgi:hypothetical protein
VAVTLSAQDCDFAFRAKTLERRLFNMPGTGSYSQLFSHLIVSSFRRSVSAGAKIPITPVEKSATH